MKGKTRRYQRRLANNVGTADTSGEKPGAALKNADLVAEANAIAQSIDITEFETMMKDYANNPSTQTGTKLFGLAMVVISQRGLAGVGPVLAVIDVVTENMHDPFSVMRELLTAKRPGWNDYHISRWMLTHDICELRELHRRAAHLERSPELPLVCFSCGHELNIQNLLAHTAEVCQSNTKKSVPSTNEVVEALGWNPVIDSVNWAIQALRDQDPAFKDGMAQVERECVLCPTKVRRGRPR